MVLSRVEIDEESEALLRL